MARKMQRALGTLVALCLALWVPALPAVSAHVETIIEVRVPESVESIEFTAHNPDNPADTDTWTPRDSRGHTVPSGWLLDATIVMKPNWVTDVNHPRLTIADFDQTVAGEGRDAVVTYTLTNWEPTDRYMLLYDWTSERFNYVTFGLNGGTWSDDEHGFDEREPGLRANQKFITPHGTVYEPRDPVRVGYTFVGWTGTSRLDATATSTDTPAVSTRENPYDFTETDPNNSAGYDRGGLVSLRADWAALPELQVADVTIVEGGEFNGCGDVVLSAVDDEQEDLLDAAHGGGVTCEGEVDVSAAGTYPIQVTATDRWGGTTTATANLIVHSESAAASPAPSLTVTDVSIVEGDDFDPHSVIVSATGGDPVVDPDAVYDTNTAGIYPLTISITGERGATVTRTANLIVQPRPGGEQGPEPGDSTSAKPAPSDARGLLSSPSGQRSLAYTGAHVQTLTTLAIVILTIIVSAVVLGARRRTPDAQQQPRDPRTTATHGGR